jgi:hypothetical protein
VIGPDFFEENIQTIAMDSEHYCTMLNIFFTNGIMKDEAKGEKCMVSTVWCNSPHGKAKHDFSQGNVYRLLNFMIW